MPITNPTTINVTGQAPLAGNIKLSPGANITLTQNGQTIIISAIGGGSGGGNFIQGLVDFGFASNLEGDVATVFVSAPWITSNSIIVCSPQGIATADHDSDDYIVEGLTAYAEGLIPGVGFNITAYAPQGTWGRYWVSATGQ